MKFFFPLVAIMIMVSSRAQTIEPAPADKAVVYFARASDLGALINFTFFDSTQVIGRFNGYKYMRYECAPGEHLFWARSENKDFVRAKLEAGKIYIIDVVPQMGAVKAAVRMYPVNSKAYRLRPILRLFSKRDAVTFSESELERIQLKMGESIERGMERADKLGDNMKFLGGTTFQPEELVFVKKKDLKRKSKN